MTRTAAVRLVRISVSFVAMIALVLITVPGCGDSGASAQAGSGAGAAAESARAGWPDEIVFGIVPTEGGTDIVERLRPLVTFLGEHLDHPVVAKPASEYAGVITAMQNRQVHLAYYGPKSYVEAARVAGAEAIIKQLSVDGQPGYYGTIVVHVDSPIGSLAEAEGRSFAFVTPNSTSGYLVPSIGIMTETGRSAEEFFGEIRYTGAHGSSMHAVATKNVEVAATNTLDMTAMVNAGQVDGSALKVIWKSALIPSAPIAVRRDIPESLKRALSEAFLAFNDEAGLLEEMSRGGFVTAHDTEYDSVRLLERHRAELSAAARVRD